MEKQSDISRDMRAILVDWMVEVQVGRCGEGAWARPMLYIGWELLWTYKHPQLRAPLHPPSHAADEPVNAPGMQAFAQHLTSLQENFELNHETLYLAVKLVDHYLVEVVSMRDKLQLIGSTAVLIASKFEVTLWCGFWRSLGVQSCGMAHPSLRCPFQCCGLNPAYRRPGSSLLFGDCQDSGVSRDDAPFESLKTA